MLVLTPYNDCGDSDWHMISQKTWVIVFYLISCLQLLEEKIKEYVS